MKSHAGRIIGALAVLIVSALTPPAQGDLFSVTDVNPDPNIFECDLTSIEKDVTIGGTNVHVFAFKDEHAAVPPAGAGLPIQVIKAKVGDLIICRYKNQLSTESASIHWHGIELDNDSDGTAVTQDAVLPGQSYTYQFQTFRPGVFWFHSHMLAGNTLFGGMYGVFIIENPIEASLQASGVLPGEADTHTLAMSDIEFDATGKVGKDLSGVTKTENELIELCHLYGIGDPGGMNTCNLAARPGGTVLVNGVKPDPAAQTPMFVVPSGKRVRLRLLNESISRHFRLKLLNSGDNKLYRIGGQGGLLNNVIVEGGTKGTWNTLYNSGEILLGSGMRSDVIIYPTGAEGTIIQLVGNPTTGTFQISTGLPADYPIAYFQISGSAGDAAPAAGQPILAGTPEEIENIKSSPTITPLQDPAPFGGSSDETIRLTTAKPTGPPAPFAQNQPGIDQYAAVLDSNAGNGDWLLVPRPPVARYAHVGDMLELTVRNDTDAAHPYHLHGFSMQPVRMVDNSTGTVLYNFDYNEFVDTVDVYGHQSYVFRTRIDDRAKFCDIAPNFPPDSGPVLAACTGNPCGGVVGRWLFHCHIVGHGALGMIGEITILPGADKPPQITCPADIIRNNDPGVCGAAVTFAPTATDDCGPVTVVCVPPSGSTFPVGTTTVTCTATDSANQSTQCTFKVTVKDAEPPQITCPADITKSNDPGVCGAVVTFAVAATDNCGPVTVVCVPPSGSTFPVGTTTVTCTATDSANLTTQCTFKVTVNDTEPPVITSAVAMSSLWPPSHDLINVGLSASATDNCPGPITMSVAIFGDEDDELPTGDGNFSPDAKNIDIGTLRLRSERQGNGDGRVYLIIVTATDHAGNQSAACQSVVVPKAQAQKDITAVNLQATAARNYFTAHGAPPPGYILIGDGPIIGPKQ